MALKIPVLSLLPLGFQIVLLSVGLGVLALWPPVEGRILLVPLTANARHVLIGAAIGQGARLVSAGPLAGSMIVSGERDRLLGTLARRGIMAMVAPAGGCGAAEGQG